MDSSTGDDAGRPSPDPNAGSEPDPTPHSTDGTQPDPNAGTDNAGVRARRGNGLSAAAYGVLAHCEPQIADALLRSLAEKGIAAYAIPYEGNVGGYLEMYPPERPLARVWVDSTAVPAARALLQTQYAGTAEPPAVAEEAAWEEIVASLRRPGAEGPVPWPDAENLALPRTATPKTDPSTGAAGGPAAISDPVGPAGPVAPTLPGDDGGPTATPEPADDDVDEHFVPPPPPPVPVPTGPSAYAVAALVGGALVLLVSTLAGDTASPALLVLAIAAIVGGFVTLVAGMREGPPTDSGPDDGAVL